MVGGKLIEQMARYGDPSEFELPIPQKLDSTANMSYSGLLTSSKRKFYEGQQEGNFKSMYERDPADLSFKQLLNLSSSIQFGAFCQIQRKVSDVLAYLHAKDIPVNCLNLAGGVSCN